MEEDIEYLKKKLNDAFEIIRNLEERVEALEGVDLDESKIPEWAHLFKH